MRYLGHVAIAVLLSFVGIDSTVAQPVSESEVRQIVTFSFLPGKSSEAIRIYREQALPLYVANESMRSFRAFREVESSVALDLMVVSGFDGMAGMDRSNSRLRELAEEESTSIGALYGAIATLSSGHTDQFVEMLPELGSGDASATRLTAFVWYRVLPGRTTAFEAAVLSRVRRWDVPKGISSATGRFLVSDGWDYLRIIGFDSLADYQAYSSGDRRGAKAMANVTTKRRQVIVSSVTDLAVR